MSYPQFNRLETLSENLKCAMKSPQESGGNSVKLSPMILLSIILYCFCAEWIQKLENWRLTKIGLKMFFYITIELRQPKKHQNWIGRRQISNFERTERGKNGLKLCKLTRWRRVTWDRPPLFFPLLSERRPASGYTSSACDLT